MTLRAYLLRLVFYPLLLLSIIVGLVIYFAWSELPELGREMTVWGIVGLTGLAALYGLVRATLFTEKLRSSFQQLQEIAVSIASGEFKENEEIDGIQETADLSKALNTMSECVQETVSRLRESAVLRERMYGEYECALLLQQQMLQRVLEDYQNERLHIKALSYTTASTLHGVLLDLKKEESSNVKLSFYEALTSGFSGMYDLLSHQELRTQCVSLILSQAGELTHFSKNMPQPLVWSTIHGNELNTENGIVLSHLDIVLVYNWGLVKCFETPAQLKAWFHKILRHFAGEGMELFVTVLQQELGFLTKKQPITHDIHILCVQFLGR